MRRKPLENVGSGVQFRVLRAVFERTWKANNVTKTIGKRVLKCRVLSYLSCARVQFERFTMRPEQLENVGSGAQFRVMRAAFERTWKAYNVTKTQWKTYAQVHNSDSLELRPSALREIHNATKTIGKHTLRRTIPSHESCF